MQLVTETVELPNPSLSLSSKYFEDSDKDGFGNSTVSVTSCTQPQGYTEQSGDCDDTEVSTHPDAIEICDEQDNNCNELLDDNDPLLQDGETRFSIL